MDQLQIYCQSASVCPTFVNWSLISTNLISLHWIPISCSSYGPCQSLAPFRWEKMAPLWMLAAGGRYPAISISRDVLSRVRTGSWWFPQVVCSTPIYWLNLSKQRPSSSFVFEHVILHRETRGISIWDRNLFSSSRTIPTTLGTNRA